MLEQKDSLRLGELLGDIGRCVCSHYSWGSPQGHAAYHLKWGIGVRKDWWAEDTLVTAMERPQRETAYQLARLMQAECGYDFPLYSAKEPGRRTAYLAVTDERAIGLLIVEPVTRWSVWAPGVMKERISRTIPIMGVVGIWIAGDYRRRGIALALVQATCDTTSIAWMGPVSDSGLRLAQAISGEEAIAIW